MIYTYNAYSNGVILGHSSFALTRKIDLYSTIVFFIVGTALVWSGNPLGLETLEWLASLVGGSLFALVYLAFTSVRSMRLKKYPEMVYFNNKTGNVEIHHRASIAKRIEIPYSEIKSISHRRHVRRWGSGSDQRSSVWYSAALFLKDGSIWDLTEDCFTDKNSAKNWIKKWVTNVSLNQINQNEIILPKTESRNLSIVREQDNLKVTWRNNYPDDMVGRLFQPFALLAFVTVMGISMMASEGPSFDSLMTKLKDLSSFGELPEILNGLMFVLPIWIVAFTWLVFVILKIYLFKQKLNKLIITNSKISTKEFDIPLDIVGTVNLDYLMNNGYIYISFQKEVEHQPDIDATLNTDTKVLFKDWIKSIPQHIKQAGELAKHAEDNLIQSISFDRYSPLDVYVIKESIRKTFATSPVYAM